MRRRQFLTSGLIYTASFSSAWAVQGAPVRTLAIVHPSAPPQILAAKSNYFIGNALDKLEESGYIEGKNLKIERYCALGSSEKLRKLCAEAVKASPDVILAISGRTVTILRDLTNKIPIVGLMSDPLSYGVVKSLSHPGGNITGASVDSGIEIWVKRITLLNEAVPGLKKLFYLAPETSWTTAVGLGVKAAAEKCGVGLVGPPVESPHQGVDFEKAFANIPEQVDAALISSASENFTNRFKIVDILQEKKLPAMYPYKDYATAGGLMAHDVNQKDLYYAIVHQIVRIFDGDLPGDLPIYQPKHFHFVINLSAAKAIGFEFNQNLVAAADEVID